MKGFLDEFKKFALRGNVIDLAVGVVIGTAFNNITNSLVSNIITPPLGLLLGKIDFKDLAISLGGSVQIKYGLFIQAIIDFLIVAFVLFLIIRFINKLHSHGEQKKEEEKKPEKSAELAVLEEIRDALKKDSA
jgi:large conductance mechanosensitive channel